MQRNELVTERMQKPIDGLRAADRYLISPCEASSLSFWKSQAFNVPDGMLVLRDDEYSEREYPDRADTPYFKLIHHLDRLEMPVLREGFSLVSPDLDGFSEHIRACYGGGPSKAELGEYACRPAYDPSLWIAVADGNGKIAASGIGELDGSIGEGSLEWIQVSPGYRRLGLGEFIVRELLWRMRGRAGFVTVSGEANSPSCPLELYLKCGFGEKVIWHVLRNRG